MKYLVVGAGFFGSVFAREMAKKGNKVDVIEKRSDVGGNAYTKVEHGIMVHKYGAHIFHTKYKKIWDYINQFGDFNNFINSPIANYNGTLYNLPFNMNTFCKIWENIQTPEQAKNIINSDKPNIKNPKNLEEQALSLVGKTIYYRLIKGYTEKQWGKPCNELPAFIIKRLPLRYTFDNNYFNDKYQGIPIDGYTNIIKNILNHKNIHAYLNVQFRDFDTKKYDKILYTGPIDAYFNYKLGSLEYRSLRFENKYYENIDSLQGNAVVNYTSKNEPFTRKIEHKFFNLENNAKHGTIVTTEYSQPWNINKEPYYPVNNKENNMLYKQYTELPHDKKVIFGGRLGQYRYYNMDQTIMMALQLSKRVWEKMSSGLHSKERR